VPIISLDHVTESDGVGRKSWALSLLARRGLPVRRGLCVPADEMDRLATRKVRADLALHLAVLRTPGVVVRSSALDEDGPYASFAGVHRTELDVPAEPHPVLEALARVGGSVASDAAKSYRRRVDVTGPGRMSGLVQEMIYADVAGVLFTAHPVTGADDFVIESAWGIGDHVVAGRVDPDRFVLARTGAVHDQRIGRKERKLVATGSGLRDIPVPEREGCAPSLSAGMLNDLTALGLACERVFRSPQDIEWAFEEGNLWITQCRPVTGL
jgi:pyruvate,water dikinase